MESFNITDSDREVRVFVSSTFKDMMNERDYLIKEVFPEIRHRCHQRGIEFTEIDLRWGVTEKQAQHGKVIEVCLKEIDRCRPFFIGILGERYGWIPPTDEYFRHKRILEEFPWIRKDIDKGLSITEMEIQYGVLRNPSIIKNALFYLRKPKASNYTLKETSGNNEKMLSNLKKTLLSQNEFPVKKFSTSDKLGNLILEDLWKIIEKSFPDLVTPDPIEQERLDHTTFLKSRLRVYIGGQKYLNRLNVHANNEDPPLVITGESGLGKSALLANWIAEYQKINPGAYILYHFTGGAPDSSDYTQIIRRILEELKIKFEINNEIPNSPEDMIKSLPQFLAQTGRHGKWILVIDALDQLENTDKAHMLNWLPEYFPPFVRVIFSTLPINMLEILQKRKYKVINVKPLLVRERKTLIKNYLGQFSKSLPEKATNMVIKAKGFENPLLLRTFLDEIRIFGEYEKLEERIDYYIRASNEEDFFNAVLLRMEEDYEKERKGLVGELLSLLWVSRKGLTERELLEISKIPPLYWSELYNSLENHLIRRNGMMNFFHNYIKEAIEECYLRDEVSKIKVHRRLVRYFEKDPLSEHSLYELPYHLERSKQWKKLKDYLTNIDVFMKIYKKDEYELTQNWRSLDKRFDMSEEYCESVKSYLRNKKLEPEKKAKIYDNIGKFLSLNAKLKVAEKMFKQSTKIKKIIFGKNHLETAESYYNLADLYSKQYRFKEETEKLFKQSLEIRKKKLGLKHIDTIMNMNSLVSFFRNRNRFSEAILLAKRAFNLCEKFLGSHHLETANSLDSLATVHMMQYNINDSIPFFKRSLGIREKILGTNHLLTAKSYYYLGCNYQLQDRFKEAEPLLKKALKISEKILGPENDYTVMILNDLSQNCYFQNEFRDAETLSNRALSTIEKTHGKDNPIASHSMLNLAIVYEAIGKYSEAEHLYYHAHVIAKKILGVNHSFTNLLLTHLGHIFYIKGNYKKAESLFKQALITSIKILGSNNLYEANILNSLANLLRNQNRFGEAELLYKRALKTFIKSFGVNNLDKASVQNDLAKLYINQQKYKKAEYLLLQALETTTNILGSRNLQEATVLNNIALLRIKQHRFKEVEGLIKKSLSIRKTRLGENHKDTAESFVTFANLKEVTDKYKQALNYYEKACKIYEKVLGKRNIHTQDTKRSIENVLKKINKKPVIEKTSNGK